MATIKLEEFLDIFQCTEDYNDYKNIFNKFAIYYQNSHSLTKSIVVISFREKSISLRLVLDELNHSFFEMVFDLKDELLSMNFLKNNMFPHLAFSDNTISSDLIFIFDMINNIYIPKYILSKDIIQL